MFISKDPTLDAYDQQVGSFVHSGVLQSGEGYDVTGNIRLPDNFGGTPGSPQTYYLIVVTDSPFAGGPSIGHPYPDEGGSPRLGGGGSGMVLRPNGRLARNR